MATEKKIKLEYLVLNEELRNKFLSLPQIEANKLHSEKWYRLSSLETNGKGDYFKYNVGFCYLKSNKKLSKLDKFLTSLVDRGELPSDVAMRLELIDSYKLKRTRNHPIIQLDINNKEFIYLLININKISIDKEKVFSNFLSQTPS